MVFAMLAIGCFSVLWASGLIPGKLYVASAQTQDDTTASRAQVKQVKGISPEAARQIAALQQEKESRTLVQRKIDSQLLYKSLMRRGLPVASDVPTLETRVEVDSKGFVAVDISARSAGALCSEFFAFSPYAAAVSSESERVPACGFLWTSILMPDCASAVTFATTLLLARRNSEPACPTAPPSATRPPT